MIIISILGVFSVLAIDIIIITAVRLLKGTNSNRKRQKNMQ